VPVRALTALLALLAGSLGVGISVEAAAKQKRAFCHPRHSKVLTKTSVVRMLYVEHPDGEDFYGTPATVYACFPKPKRRVKLFDIPAAETWKPDITRIRNRYFAVAATSIDEVCGKYQQPDCVSHEVAVYGTRSGGVRCSRARTATALALTSNGWIAWLTSGGTGRPSTLWACDSAGVRRLDEGTIDAGSVRAVRHTVEWTGAGQPRSADLR
jgi:hypothetical protein